jgi:DNA adenine methylase Dam
VGGKQRQLKHILPHIPRHYDWYHEPFLGGGAVFFALEPEKSTINDDFQLLMAFYHGLQQQPDTIATELRVLEGRQTKEDYEAIRREEFPLYASSLTAKGVARLYYLNKLSYNAMIRFNKSGRYNVPYGKPLRNLFNVNHLQSASDLLKRTHLSCADYKEYFIKLLNDFGNLEGHVIYVDPPYPDTHAEYVIHSDFDDWEVKMLQMWCNALHAMGATVIVSLSDAMAASWRDWERHDLGVKYTADRRSKPLRASQAILVKRG